MGCGVGAAGWLAAAPASAGDADSPLSRLQQRSGDERWQELRSKTQTAPATTPLPAALAPRAPGSSLIDAARSAPSPQSRPEAPTRELQPVESDESRTQIVSTPTLDDSAFDEPAQPFEPAPLLRQDTPAPEDFPRPLPSRAALLESEEAAISMQDLPAETAPAARTFALRPITDIQPFFDYSPTGEDPCKHLCPLRDGLCPPDPDNLCPEPFEMSMAGSPERFFPHLEYYWSASNLYHNPLYFENPALERYGHVHFNDCVEPAYSMARFGAQFIGLPYQMALDHACRRQYSLGWYRPGDFAPKLIYQPPLNARAAGTAAVAYTGLFLLVP